MTLFSLCSVSLYHKALNLFLLPLFLWLTLWRYRVRRMTFTDENPSMYYFVVPSVSIFYWHWEYIVFVIATHSKGFEQVDIRTSTLYTGYILLVPKIHSEGFWTNSRGWIRGSIYHCRTHVGLCRCIIMTSIVIWSYNIKPLVLSIVWFNLFVLSISNNSWVLNLMLLQNTNITKDK